MADKTMTALNRLVKASMGKPYKRRTLKGVRVTLHPIYYDSPYEALWIRQQLEMRKLRRECKHPGKTLMIELADEDGWLNERYSAVCPDCGQLWLKDGSAKEDF